MKDLFPTQNLISRVKTQEQILGIKFQDLWH